MYVDRRTDITKAKGVLCIYAKTHGRYFRSINSGTQRFDTVYKPELFIHLPVN